MKVTVILVGIGTLGTIHKYLVRGLETLKLGGQVETTLTVALLRSVRILRSVVETCGHLLSLRL